MSASTLSTSRYHPSALTDDEQVMYLSLCGLQAWGMYRAGMSRGLLLEMHRFENPVAALLPGITEVLRGCVGTPTFPTATELRTFIWQQVETDGHELVRSDFKYQSYVSYAKHDMEIATMHGHPAKDERAAGADKVATFMIDYVVNRLYKGWDSSRDNYRALMARIWFAMCDAAAGVTATRDEVTA